MPSGLSETVTTRRTATLANLADPLTPTMLLETMSVNGGNPFTILEDPGHAAYVAELILSRAEVGTGSAKVSSGGAAVTPGGAYGSVGAGVIIPLPTGKSRLVPRRA